MAYLDDRIWCHPKFAGLSDSAGWLWTKGITYASGFHTQGVLNPGVQKAIGAKPKTRQELVAAALWDEQPDGSVVIHDWHEYNGARDERKAKDRQRKKAAYHAAKQNGDSAGEDAEKVRNIIGEKLGER